MNVLLEKVSKWLAYNELSLNIAKTKFMTFGNCRDSVTVEINIEIQIKIARAENYKYLGIIFDCNVKWNKHIEHIIYKLNI